MSEVLLLLLSLAVLVLAATVYVQGRRIDRLEKNQLRSHAKTNERISELARASADSHVALRSLSLAIADYVLPPEFRSKLPPH